MCGIAGVFGARAPEVVDRMLRVLAHRGPDDQHCVAGEDFTLGARRLSIIDLAGGRQPLSTPDQSVWACQNGEIYNFPELRQQLQSQGHQFSNRSDTEVLPHLYQLHGDRMATAIHGMFAVAVWDKVNKRGLLIRDRAGKKPLYYCLHQGHLWFASEIKALLQIPGFQRKLNEEAVHHFLSLKNVPAPLSAFEGIHMLQPAHQLIWEDGRIRRLEAYWKLDWTPLEGDLHEQELAEELLQRLQRGVKRRLLADVPVGFFLSGGLDSSLATALAASSSSHKVKTFTLRYRADSSTPGKELDLACARQIARQYDTEHYEEELDFSRFQEELPAILTHFDEPFGGVMSTYFLSRLIVKHLKVAISGDGADELFGSYLSHRLARPLAEFARGKTDDLGHFQDQPEFLARLASPHDWEWRSQLFVFTEEDKRKLYRPERLQSYSTNDYLRHLFAKCTAQDPLNRVLEVEFNTQLPDQVLAFADRLSMAHSLEIRTGFLDTEVMEFAARIPGRFKIHGQEVKSVLKTAARKYLPAEAIDRPKEGFVMPVNQWLSGWLLEYARTTLSPANLEHHGLFRSQEVTRILEEFAAGNTALANKVLSLLCFQIWYDLYYQT
ncbi:MAG: asparagine synthase (glutamine-hydrolyzing) [Candidatus Eremiobacteraeota bacterium]|nr:asparagine synthase (glutamine-hydrolyzing) [Candidatus Eremiobacteraeota bacterium]MCW5868656.1 asparagine synthase (glutamine-hydrolyzing) [Candidatus Eremiobacteraeota bacterium]